MFLFSQSTKGLALAELKEGERWGGEGETCFCSQKGPLYTHTPQPHFISERPTPALRVKRLEQVPTFTSQLLAVTVPWCTEFQAPESWNQGTTLLLGMILQSACSIKGATIGTQWYRSKWFFSSSGDCFKKILNPAFFCHWSVFMLGMSAPLGRITEAVSHSL